MCKCVFIFVSDFRILREPRIFQLMTFVHEIQWGLKKEQEDALWRDGKGYKSARSWQGSSLFRIFDCCPKFSHCIAYSQLTSFQVPLVSTKLHKSGYKEFLIPLELLIQFETSFWLDFDLQIPDRPHNHNTIVS